MYRNVYHCEYYLRLGSEEQRRRLSSFCDNSTVRMSAIKLVSIDRKLSNWRIGGLQTKNDTKPTRAKQTHRTYMFLQIHCISLKFVHFDVHSSSWDKPFSTLDERDSHSYSHVSCRAKRHAAHGRASTNSIASSWRFCRSSPNKCWPFNRHAPKTWVPSCLKVLRHPCSMLRFRASMLLRYLKRWALFGFQGFVELPSLYMYMTYWFAYAAILCKFDVKILETAEHLSESKGLPLFLALVYIYWNI